MNEEHRNALQASLHDICKDLDAEDILPYLCSRGVVEDGQVQEIMAIPRKPMRNMQLVTIIKAAGPLAFQVFIDALQICTKEHLVENILAHLPSCSTQQLSLSEMKATVQQSLKNMYITRFQKVHPLSLPFTFDIENTWVSLALKDDVQNSRPTEGHAKMLKRAFEKSRMLIIEGNPATGKTSLMRRLAYEWATGKRGLSDFDLIIYAEFRELCEQTFETVADLVIQFNKNYENFIGRENLEYLKVLLSNKKYCEEQRILLLLDGYDESSLDKQCNELSTYFSSCALKSPLMFNIVLTTRPSYLSMYRGNEGRFAFAEVLGFITKYQKEKYIANHFLSKTMVDSKKNIAAVHYLLNNNENLGKLAKTPLFLTFICLVHERIVNGTLLELYCNIIWWLIDRHQKHNLDCDVPALFGFQNGSPDKFETIQDHYLHFPQLHCLSKMALRNLKKDIVGYSEYEKFNLQSIVEQVGLLRKEKKRDNTLKLISTLHFPHRTIQEFLAAFNCFCSNDTVSERLSPGSKLDTSKMNEFGRFLLRIALSDKLPVQMEKRKYYFDRITDIKLDITFDAFNTTAGFDNKPLNWFLSQCTNLQSITLYGKLNNANLTRNMSDETSIHKESVITSKMSGPLLFSFSDLIKLHSLSFLRCIFEANFQLSVINCPSLKYLQFDRCEMKSNTNLGIAILPAIDSVQFRDCKIDLETWQSITNAIRDSSLKCLKLSFGEDTVKNKKKLTFGKVSNRNKLFFGKDFNNEFLIHLQKCNNVDKMEITFWNYRIRQNDLLQFSDLIKLHSVAFWRCTFEANSQLSFSNCQSLKNLKFQCCQIESGTNLGFATLPAIDTVGFRECTLNLATWQSTTEQIRNSSVKCLNLSADYFAKEEYPEFLHLLQKCERIEEIFVKNVHDWGAHSNISNIDKEEVTVNLAETARKLRGLRSIIIICNADQYDRVLDECSKLRERNKERIEVAGQERNPEFSLKYVQCE